MHSTNISLGTNDSTGHSAPLPILEMGKETKVSRILSYGAPKDEQKQKHPSICIAKLIAILAGTEPPVVLVGSKCDIMTIDRIQMAKPTKHIFSTWGIHKIPRTLRSKYWWRTFLRLLLYSIRHVYCYGYRATKMNTCSWTKGKWKPTANVSDVHNKEVREMQRPNYRHVKT